MIALLLALLAAVAPVNAFKPPPTLARFMKSDAFVRAVVGPLGSGKSSACVMELARRAGQQQPGPDGCRRTRFAIIRNTGPQLQDTTRKTFEQWIPDRAGEWNESEFTFLLRGTRQDDGSAVESEILFRALDRPRDVRKVLSLELTGAYVNEAREIAKEVIDGLQGRVGRYPSQADGGPNWFGVWMDTNPWHTGHWGYKLFSKERPEGFELFEQPDGLSARAENLANLVPGYYARLILGKDAEWVDEYVRSKYPSSDKGSVYGELLAQLEARGRVGTFEHPSDGVFVNLDLGVSDATALLFWRLNEYRMPDVLDWYEATGKGMEHYFSIIDNRGWRINKVWLPHDAKARTWQTGVSTVQQFINHYGADRVAIGPELDIADGISAARWLLEQPMRWHARAADGLERLRAYRYLWDEEKKVFSKKPMHDFTSHTADCFRYVACVAHATELLMRPAPTEPTRPAARASDSFTLDEIWDTGPTRSGGRV